MASGDSFAHLHVHTEYSMLDGAARVGELLDEAVALGMPAIAITDHGNNFGAFEFWRQAKARGIKPIIGTEAYLTPGTHRSDKTRVRWAEGEGLNADDVGGGGAYTHMTLLAETTEGMQNLFRLSSLASLEGQYFKPRMDRELLAQYSTGIIATTGCVGGEVQTRLRLGQYEEARQAAAEFRDIFGAENFYAEIMDHGIEIERRTQAELLRLAKDLGLPLVATNDLHYTHSHDAAAHAALLCVQSGSTMHDPKRFKFDADEFYLKSPAEMRHLFRDYPEACDATLLIAERCNAEFDPQEGRYMARFPVPEGETDVSWFRKEVDRGLAARYPDGITERVRQQADYEMDVIISKGYASYFLVVADFINWSKNNGIRVGPGRGSGAGSIAAYAMRITDLDPLEHGLIFERFLNPERESMPDFDVDFDDRRRGEVIRYVTEKYGSDHVAQIVTYGTIAAKQALKDAARVLGHPFAMGDRLTKAMPDPAQGHNMPLASVFDPGADRYHEAKDLREIIEGDPEARVVFDTAVGLEGLRRQWGVHAAGVILSSEPLLDVIPIMRREQDGQIITQFDYPAAEALGLVKMDFLGLRNLTIIDDALDNIEANRGHRPVLEDLPFTDEATYRLLSSGETLGVFQLDSGPLRSLLKLMRPDSFEDISAVIALYRPGPMGADSHTNYALRKNGQQPITPIHPELETPLADILEESYGLIIYQEQVMAIAQRVAGYSLGQADLLRRAMGKKKKEILDQEFAPFSEGMRANGFSDAAITKLWDILVPFSDYAFNKAHSAAYGVISYWTAYLKAHYPAEYMAALLTSVGDKKDTMAIYLAECRRMGIKVLAPDVNESVAFFSAAGEDIRFGLGAVRNVGFGAVEQIRAAREEHGAFTGLHDFLTKIPLAVVNKRTVESLIKAGAFDSLHPVRRALYEVHEEAVEAAVSIKRNEASGMVGFDFDSLWDEPEQAVDVVPELPEWAKRDKLAFEREMLGLYVSDHPLAGFEQQLQSLATHSIGTLLAGDGLEDGQVVTIAGLVTAAQQRIAKSSGNPWGMLTVQDFGGEIQVSFFAKNYLEFWPLVAEDAIVVIKGRLQQRDDGWTIMGQTIRVPELASLGASSTAPLTLRIRESAATSDRIAQLEAALRRHPGEAEVRLLLLRESSAGLFELPHRVDRGPNLTSELKALLGARAFS
ncbi:MAG TPA: DNA polymerase III subunit alpha [Microbacteriaceae bacterium]|nr:DNA polymerase III subunit alpha [Microbacteriaceae bacterium]